MPRVPHREARVPQRDDLIDRSPIARATDVGQPVGGVGRRLTAKPVRRGPDHLGSMTGLVERANERPGDDQVPAFDERWRGGDDENDSHGPDRSRPT
jgi:hypothetical protein